MASASGTTSSPRKRPRAQSAKFPRARQFSYESPDRLKELEKGFVLDAVSLSKHANDETGRTHPSLNLGIPQYNALKDSHCKTYFKMKGLPKCVNQGKEKTSQGDVDSDVTSSMMGPVFDQFLRNSSAKQYLKERESIGAGYTRRFYGGHLTVPTAPPKVGYHGEEGFRRNTPNLRWKRSVFDYEDPFDDPKPINRRLRTQSAPATMRLMRQKSATVYRQPPGGRRIVSAIPRTFEYKLPLDTRELATGP